MLIAQDMAAQNDSPRSSAQGSADPIGVQMEDAPADLPEPAAQQQEAVDLSSWLEELEIEGILTRQKSVSKAEWERLGAQPGQRRLEPALRSSLGLLDTSSKGPRASLAGDEDLAAPDSKWGRRFRNRSIFLLPLMRPTRYFPRLWTVLVMLLDATYTAFVVPIEIAFAPNILDWRWEIIVDFVAGVVFCLDILVMLHVGFYVKYNLKRKLVMDGRIVLRYYWRRGTLAADLLSILPFLVEFAVVVFVPNGVRNAAFFRALGLLRVLRLFRLLSFIKNTLKISIGLMGKKVFGWLPPVMIYFFDIIYFALILVNFLGCLWYFTAREEGLETSWLMAVGIEDLTAASKPRQYLAAVYFAMTTITTIGYGDVTPKTGLEEGVAMMVMLVGVVFFGLVISGLATVLQEASRSARRASLLRHKFEEVEWWMRHRGLPWDLRQKIIAYYSQVWVRSDDGKDERIFNELPIALRGDVASFLISDVLVASELFQVMDPDARKRLAAKLRPSYVPPGHDLCQEGDDADSLWILQEGEVVALRHTRQLDLLTAPAILGEGVLLRDHLPEAGKRACNFRALSGCTVWELRMQDLAPVLAVYPDLLKDVVGAFQRNLEARIAADPAPHWRLLQRATHDLLQASVPPGSAVFHHVSSASQPAAHESAAAASSQEPLAMPSVADVAAAAVAAMAQRRQSTADAIAPNPGEDMLPTVSLADIESGSALRLQQPVRQQVPEEAAATSGRVLHHEASAPGSSALPSSPFGGALGQLRQRVQHSSDLSVAGSALALAFARQLAGRAAATRAVRLGSAAPAAGPAGANSSSPDNPT